MVTNAGLVGAGLLVGVGKGAMEIALDHLRGKREAAERQLDRDWRAGESEKDRTFRGQEADEQRTFQEGQTTRTLTHQAEQGELTRTHANGLLNNTRQIVDRDGYVWQEGRDGVAVPVKGADGQQLRTNPKSAGTEPLEEVYDEESPTGSKLVPRSQASGQPSGKNADKRVEGMAEVNDAARRDARKQAEKEASDKAGTFRSDATDFADTEGSREKYIERRTNEILAERKGKKPATEAAAPTAKAAQPEADIKTRPKGGGTKSSPYQAATQDDIDWFKTNAAPGSVISVNGKLYTK